MIKNKITEYMSALILVSYMSLIFYLSSIPGSAVQISTPDYILHGLAFGGLYFLINLYLIHYMELEQSLWVGLILNLLYALGDEAHQYFVPGRFPDWWDIAADMIGAVLVMLALLVLNRLFFVKKSRT